MTGRSDTMLNMPYDVTTFFQLLQLFIIVGVVLFFIFKPLKKPVITPDQQEPGIAAKASRTSSLVLRIIIVLASGFFACAGLVGILGAWIGKDANDMEQFFSIFYLMPMLVIAGPVFIVSLIKTIKFYKINK